MTNNLNHSRSEFSRMFLFISIAYVASLLTSNTVATKIIMIGPLSVAAGIICFPITYIINDVVTEVYGYRRAKLLIWGGFSALAFMSVAYALATWLTPAPFYTAEAAFDTIFQQIPRIAVGSLGGYMIGSFLNSIVMSKMKVLTKGKHLWARTIGSTIVGEAADSTVFALIAFFGTFALSQVALIALSGFLLKSAYEIIATPLTYWVIARIKRLEGTDVYDHDVSYGVL